MKHSLCQVPYGRVTSVPPPPFPVQWHSLCKGLGKGLPVLQHPTQHICFGSSTKEHKPRGEGKRRAETSLQLYQGLAFVFYR